MKPTGAQAGRADAAEHGPGSVAGDGQLLQAYGVLELISHAAWVFDLDRGRMVWANRLALQVWNAASLHELCSRDMGVDMSPAVARRLRQYQQDFEHSAARFTEQWTLYPNGQPRTLHMVFCGHRLADGRMALFCEAMDRQQPSDPESIRSVEALLHTEVMISMYGPRGRLLYRNPAARDRLPEPQPGGLNYIVDRHQRAQLRVSLRRQGEARIVALVQTRQGERWHEISVRRCRDAVTGVPAWLLSEVDVSDVKDAESHAHYLAQHDPLTGLPNRSSLAACFQPALEALGRAGRQAALLFIDLDYFKDVNDSLGHTAGDQLLVEIARRLRSETRQGDLIARLGGDEFLVLLATEEVVNEVSAPIERIRKSISRSVMLGQTPVRVSSSVGVSIFPHDGLSIDELLRCADMAMYRAKERGRDGMARYSADLAVKAQMRLALEVELGSALENGEMEVYYQPRLDIASGRIVGAEALVRWNHPRRGLVSPADFIPLCEQSGLILAVGRFVLEQAVRQQVAWAAQGWPLLISVNLSPRQLADAQLLDSFMEILERWGADCSGLELEITESMLLGHDKQTVRTLEQLGQQGFRIAIDDFGTGYSNLAYLQRYPLQTLKIDRTFIQSIADNAPITDLIISMCRILGLHMVAEGVETEAQLQWLSSRGVHEFQGFLFSRPVPAPRFEALLAARQ
ncbi:EAL domain-containing protein [Paracidovorax wautersii]|uniref:putative bifunctional diguanylate cyclase/phosphodiesterase n=1 Tax=Paracidovorax wautersii TaxID=1177982 RepID=UPI0031E33936